jgi:quinol monooxygenase YgiN
MIIVSGRIYVEVENRDLFIKKSLIAVEAARQNKGCRDFVVAADPLEKNRVNIYEEWESEDELNEFRGSGPDSDISSLIVSAEVSQHKVE